MDDLGWNDVGFHGSTQVSTPNIDALARSGTILNRHYAQEFCNPSRAALLTGMYPMRVGYQEDNQSYMDANGLPLQYTLLPDWLKSLGYSTHMIGKWDLGVKNVWQLPCSRGFDSFLGSYIGAINYWAHTKSSNGCQGVELHDDTPQERKMVDQEDVFLTDLYLNRSIQVIKDAESPFFLYYATQGVHSPLDPPIRYMERFAFIQDEIRQRYLAHVKAEDDAIGVMIETLKEEGLYEDTIIVFSSDNGGDWDLGDSLPSSYPLRGYKKTQFEGGVRVASFVKAPGIAEETSSNLLMHLTDWLPTLYAAAGGNPNDLDKSTDGFNQWDALRGLSEPIRKEVLVGLNKGFSTIIQDQFKLMISESDPSNIEWRSYSDDISSDMDRQYVVDGWKLPLVYCGNETLYIPCSVQLDLYHCLYDLENDPCEYTDLSMLYPDVMVELQWAIEKHRLAMGDITHSTDNLCTSNSQTWEDYFLGYSFSSGMPF